MMQLSRDSFNSSNCSQKKSITRHRNICVVLGCLAEKMAGPNSVFLLRLVIGHYYGRCKNNAVFHLP